MEVTAGAEMSVIVRCNPSQRARGLIWIQYHNYPNADAQYRRLPLPWATLVVTLSGPRWWRNPGGGWEKFPRMALRGPATTWSEGRDAPTNGNEYLAALIEPWALFPIFGIPASEICNGVIDVEHLWPRDGTRIYDEIAGARGSREKIFRLSRELEARIRNDLSDPRLRNYIVACRSHGGAGELSSFAPPLGCSGRWFRQLFKDAIGVTPKRWALLERFASQARDLHPISWGTRDDYVDPGYVDQPHAIHEFVRHAGVTPGQYRKFKASGDPRVFVLHAHAEMSC